MAGKMVEFSSNGGTCAGYLTEPKTGSGQGVIVLQEWWGLVEHIKDVADRFAAEGFTALAPDLYHGDVAKSPDDAGKLMMALNIAETEKDLRGAIDFLLDSNACSSEKIGTVGFCMGGQLSLFAACANHKVGACVIYYGIHPQVLPDIPNLQAPVLGFFGERDANVGPEVARKLESQLQDAGKDVEIHIYEGAGHGFFNDTREETYNEGCAKDTWDRMMALYRQNLG